MIIVSCINIFCFTFKADLFNYLNIFMKNIIALSKKRYLFR